ncbi:MAG: 23S rRNA (uridine(2552)-2'-O)-methyltransferase RlmE [Gammaproteobacteria bacterium]|nr:23S rRNA (uridine(2552)-2'-O)-methyltransferase RlmE [Gammaproteobacteria bacterium]
MARSKSSQQWLQRHINDPYVHQAQKEGWRSRAVYKLKELDEKYGLIKPGMTVVDLGAAPGSWSQWAIGQVGDKGHVYALDILPMDVIAGVDFLQGDFREESVMNDLLGRMHGARADLVLSDMAPNMSGVGAVDVTRAIYLCELALDLATQVLKPGGNFLAKVFQGPGSDEYLKAVRGQFASAAVKKPDASRDRSREIYLLARNYTGPRNA